MSVVQLPGLLGAYGKVMRDDDGEDTRVRQQQDLGSYQGVCIFFQGNRNCEDIFKQRGNTIKFTSWTITWPQREAAALMKGEKLMKGCGSEEGFVIY